MPDQDSTVDALARAINEAQDLGLTTQGPTGCAGIGRRKKWDELTTDERIERLRECLRSKDMAVQAIREDLLRLMNHTHGAHGELLGPLHGFPQCAELRRYDPLE